jgi:hypothetical protein
MPEDAPAGSPVELKLDAQTFNLYEGEYPCMVPEDEYQGLVSCKEIIFASVKDMVDIVGREHWAGGKGPVVYSARELTGEDVFDEEDVCKFLEYNLDPDTTDTLAAKPVEEIDTMSLLVILRTWFDQTMRGHYFRVTGDVVVMKPPS